ncbi:transcriptional corepressor LEUNIG-like protein, partial [Trifolium pratense]
GVNRYYMCLIDLLGLGGGGNFDLCLDGYSFQMYLYDYLKKRGLSYTAEMFRREAQVTTQPPLEFHEYPHGFFCFCFNIELTIL